MFCERCNIDFPEGLRYCKWCGQSLGERQRVTSELYTCPACSSQVRKGWVFCKSCGSRLDTAPPKPKTSEIFCPRCGSKSATSSLNCVRCGEDLSQFEEPVATREQKTATPGGCWSCGEPLEPNSLYCKSCGSAVYAEPSDSDERKLLCPTCKSFSPVGSLDCRICGAPLEEPRNTDVPSDAVSPSRKPGPRGPSGELEKEPSTLPDLGEHLAQMRRARTQDDVQTTQVPIAEIDSGAHTFILSATEAASQQKQQPTVENTDELGSTTEPAPTGNQTPARASSDASSERAAADESDSSTTNLKKTRITSPVEGETTTAIERSEIDQATSRIVADTTASVPQADTSIAERPTVALGADEFQAQGPPPIRPVAPSRQAAAAPPAGTRPPTAVPRPRPVRPPQAQAQPRPSSKKGALAIVSGIVVALILGATGYLIWWFVAGKPRPQPAAPTPRVEAPVTTPAPPPAPSAPAPPVGMVKVAGGSYTIGREGGDPLESPAHEAQVTPFYIDRTEVTNAEYKKFIDATGHPAPIHWRGGSFAPGEDRLPVTGVTWQDATDYAEWAGKRLPTEVEWEAAARGNDGRLYPWGNEWRSGIANIGIKPGRIEEVGRFPDGASPSGAQDMIGNVWEWTADEITVYPGSRGTISTEPLVNYRVVRGGAFDGDKRHDASYRGYLDASKPYPKVGFRCVKDAK